MTNVATLSNRPFGATAINPLGQMAGGSLGDAAILSNGVVTDLGNLGGTSSYAQAINSAGLTVGASYIPYVNGATIEHAFLYNGTKMIDLGTLANSLQGVNSYATDINDLGQIVGTSQTSINTDPSHAFLYGNGVMTDMGTLPTYTNSQTTAINNHGQILGFCTSFSGGSRAFIYSGGVMRDLNTLLDSSGAGWYLPGDGDINDNGVIACDGSTPSGERHVLLLTPVPEPPSVILLAFGAMLLGGCAAARLGISTNLINAAVRQTPRRSAV